MPLKNKSFPFNALSAQRWAIKMEKKIQSENKVLINQAKDKKHKKYG